MNGYTEVKRASDSYLGIPSQCFAANKAKIGEFNPRGREQYLANIGMKVNAKLNGTNVVLSKSLFPWMNSPYMVFGTALPTVLSTLRPRPCQWERAASGGRRAAAQGRT